MAAAEPTLAALPSAPLRYLLATRPAFLSVTLGSCLIGLGSAYAAEVPISAWKAVVTILFAMAAHADEREAHRLEDHHLLAQAQDGALGEAAIFGCVRHARTAIKL